MHENFTFIKGDIRNIDDCLKASKNVDVILHHLNSAQAWQFIFFSKSNNRNSISSWKAKVTTYTIFFLGHL